MYFLAKKKVESHCDYHKRKRCRRRREGAVAEILLARAQGALDARGRHRDVVLAVVLGVIARVAVGEGKARVIRLLRLSVLGDEAIVGALGTRRFL